MKVKCTIIAMAMLTSCILFSGCATKYLQNEAREWAVAQGMETDPVAPGYVFVASEGIDSDTGLLQYNAHQQSLIKFIGSTGIQLSDLAVKLWPIKYRIAQVFDYGVLPVAGGTAAYALAESINSSSSSDDHSSRTEKKTVYQIDSGGGDVRIGDGDTSDETTIQTSYEESYEVTEYTDTGAAE